MPDALPDHLAAEVAEVADNFEASMVSTGTTLVQVISERRVVHLLEVGWDAEPPYYVMEFLSGGSLADRLDKDFRGRYNYKNVRAYADMYDDAVKMMHRDLRSPWTL